MFFVIIAVLLGLTIRSINSALERARRNEHNLLAEVAERKRAEEAIRFYSERLKILHEIDQAIAASQAPDVIAQVALDQLRQLVACKRASVGLFDFKENVITILACTQDTGEAQPGAGARLPLEYFEFTKELAHGQVRVRENIQALPEQTPTMRDLSAAGVRAYMSVPLIVAGELIGSLNLGASSPSVFKPDLIEIAQEVGHSLAVAIHQARLRAERRRHAAQIEASLKEKEVLLQEIHHRVKNNLQVISSLLNLQAGYVDDPETLSIFQDSQHRIRSMALIHEKLYRSANLARIDFADYIRDLGAYLFRSQNAEERDIKLDIQADDIFLDIDTAVPCGLILNELVTNTLKHAFPDGRTGETRIELTAGSNGQVGLVIGDNGVGFPADVDFRETESLGLQLVNSLVEQLDGVIEMHSKGGTEFKITFITAL